MKTTIGISKIIFLLIILQNFSARCAVPTDAGEFYITYIILYYMFHVNVS